MWRWSQEQHMKSSWDNKGTNKHEEHHSFWNEFIHVVYHLQRWNHLDTVDQLNTFAAMQNFPCVPFPSKTFIEVQAGYLLWCQCTAELRALNDMITVSGTYWCTLIDEIDWLIEHGFTSAPTQYRLYGRRFLQVWWPNQQCQSTEGGWLVIQTGLNLTMLTSPCYNTSTFHDTTELHDSTRNINTMTALHRIHLTKQTVASPLHATIRRDTLSAHVPVLRPVSCTSPMCYPKGWHASCCATLSHRQQCTSTASAVLSTDHPKTNHSAVYVCCITSSFEMRPCDPVATRAW